MKLCSLYFLTRYWRRLGKNVLAKSNIILEDDQWWIFRPGYAPARINSSSYSWLCPVLGAILGVLLSYWAKSIIFLILHGGNWWKMLLEFFQWKKAYFFLFAYFCVALRRNEYPPLPTYWNSLRITQTDRQRADK